MSIFDIFRRRPKYWEAYKNFLITDCRIPFNTLLPLENRCDAILSSILSGKKKIELERVTDDDRMLLEMGIAAKTADKKFNVTLLAPEAGLKRDLSSALQQWQPQNGTIAVGEYLPSEKGNDICIDLFNSTTVELKTKD